MIPTLGHTVYTHGQILTLQSEKGVSEGRKSVFHVDSSKWTDRIQ